MVRYCRLPLLIVVFVVLSSCPGGGRAGRRTPEELAFLNMLADEGFVVRAPSSSFGLDANGGGTLDNDEFRSGRAAELLPPLVGAQNDEARLEVLAGLLSGTGVPENLDAFLSSLSETVWPLLQERRAVLRDARLEAETAEILSLVDEAVSATAAPDSAARMDRVLTRMSELGYHALLGANRIYLPLPPGAAAGRRVSVASVSFHPNGRIAEVDLVEAVRLPLTAGLLPEGTEALIGGSPPDLVFDESGALIEARFAEPADLALPSGSSGRVVAASAKFFASGALREAVLSQPATVLLPTGTLVPATYLSFFESGRMREAVFAEAAALPMRGGASARAVSAAFYEDGSLAQTFLAGEAMIVFPGEAGSIQAEVRSAAWYPDGAARELRFAGRDAVGVPNGGVGLASSAAFYTDGALRSAVFVEPAAIVLLAGGAVDATADVTSVEYSEDGHLVAADFAEACELALPDGRSVMIGGPASASPDAVWYPDGGLREVHCLENPDVVAANFADLLYYDTAGRLLSARYPNGAELNLPAGVEGAVRAVRYDAEGRVRQADFAEPIAVRLVSLFAPSGFDAVSASSLSFAADGSVSRVILAQPSSAESTNGVTLPWGVPAPVVWAEFRPDGAPSSLYLSETVSVSLPEGRAARAAGLLVLNADGLPVDLTLAEPTEVLIEGRPLVAFRRVILDRSGTRIIRVY